MKILLKVLLGLVVAVALLASAGFIWAQGKSASVLERTVETHTVDFPVPFPLDSAEVAELRLSGEEAGSLAVERARERGRHLVEARYACSECHGEDFGGGVMVDDPMLGRLLGSNITAGEGGTTSDYTPADWDRIVRHGVRPDGRPAAMPAEDFRRMSDRELSDIVVYVSSVPPVDATVPPVSLGPLGTVLVATGALPLSADRIGEHHAAHPEAPPEEAVSVEFGEHLAAVCVGCHGEDLAGGPIAGGDPSWGPAANLTPHAEGLGDWSYEDFVTSVRDGTRPDGTPIVEPMEMVFPFMGRMTETELQALWEYLRSLPATPTGS